MSRFKDGDPVWVDRLGDTYPSRYRAIICGIYGYPHEAFTFYIVKWIDNPDPKAKWTCSVMIGSCIDPRKEDGDAFGRMTEEELLTALTAFTK